MAGEGTFPKTDGDILFASEVNNLRNSLRVIYTGTGFDVFDTGPTTGSVELTSISSSDLAGATYLEIDITANFKAIGQGSSSTARTTLQIQTKQIGGSYSDTLSQVDILNASDSSSSLNGYTSLRQTFKYIHTLTAGEKTNGVQVKILTTATGTSTGVASINNIQTLLFAI